MSSIDRRSFLRGGLTVAALATAGASTACSGSVAASFFTALLFCLLTRSFVEVDVLMQFQIGSRDRRSNRRLSMTVAAHLRQSTGMFIFLRNAVYRGSPRSLRSIGSDLMSVRNRWRA